jgi:CheY-like chemotaxis protein
VPAGYGKAALDLIASTGLPDIITTDLMMPVMGGNELIRRLRAEPPTASIPIVVLSANAQAAEGLRAADGADAVMSKPFLSLNLVRLVEHLRGAVHQSPVTRRKS